MFQGSLRLAFSTVALPVCLQRPGLVHQSCLNLFGKVASSSLLHPCLSLLFPSHPSCLIIFINFLPSLLLEGEGGRESEREKGIHFSKLAVVWMRGGWLRPHLFTVLHVCVCVHLCNFPKQLYNLSALGDPEMKPSLILLPLDPGLPNGSVCIRNHKSCTSETCV